MKKITLLLIVGLFASVGSVYAHCGSCGIGDANEPDMAAIVAEKTEKMTAELGLSADQKNQLQAVIQTKMEKKHQIKADKTAAMDALHEEFQTNLKNILNEEQLKKWEETKKDHHGKAMCPMCKDGKKCDMCLKKEKKDKK